MSEQVLAVLVVLGFAAILLAAGYFAVIRPMRQESKGLSEMARSLRRMRDEAREDGTDFKPIASLAQTMVKREDK